MQNMYILIYRLLHSEVTHNPVLEVTKANSIPDLNNVTMAE